MERSAVQNLRKLELFHFIKNFKTKNNNKIIFSKFWQKKKRKEIQFMPKW